MNWVHDEEERLNQELKFNINKKQAKNKICGHKSKEYKTYH